MNPAETPGVEAKAVELASKFQINCKSCRNPDDAERDRTFFEDSVCRVVLRTDNQCWLGRYIFVPKVHLDPVVFWDHDVADM